MDVCIAILAKDKEHCLDLYLKCIDHQTFPKEKTHLYIRTNNNNDRTKEMLQAWDKTKYKSVYFDHSDVPEQVQKYGQHEWNNERFKVLAKIRQESVEYARKLNAHYFVIDCDNFIEPNVLDTLLKTHLPVIGPMLRVPNGIPADKKWYANYHNVATSTGYFEENSMYYRIFAGEVKGLIEVDVIHCTYLIRHEVLNQIKYDDDSGRYEYVIFSDVLRKNNIQQYLDNRQYYGFITFAERKEDIIIP
jgi:hypothetical protein